MTSKQLAAKVAELTLAKKASEVVILDLRKLTSVTDYFVICSGQSDTQVKAISDHIEQELERENLRFWHKEGYSNLQWVLLDYVDVVVHIFLPHIREFYGLERLWGDAEISEVKDEDES